MEWKYIKPLTDVNSIYIFEKIIGVTLPEDYKEFIKNFNGSRPVKKLFKCEDGIERVIKSFLSFNHENLENIFEVYEWLKNELPIKHFAIAIDPAGNFLCYDENLQIKFWNHEISREIFVATSFSELLEKLY